MAGEEIRNQILSGAQKLFQEKGFVKISMEDVARSIGKGKSTLYYYFKSKEDIFSAVLDMEINDIILETIRQMNMATSFLEKLETFSKVKFDMVRKRKALYATMESMIEPEYAQQYNQIKNAAHVAYVQKEKISLLPIFMDAISKNVIRRIDDKELERVMLLFLSSLRGIIRESLLYSRPQDIRKMLRSYCTIFTLGLR